MLLEQTLKEYPLKCKKHNGSKQKKLAPPLINDTTTNSDDSDSYEEQAFHQHHTRVENEAKNDP